MIPSEERDQQISFWDEKPQWCKPWSIVFTGVFILAFSIWWPGYLWLTILLSVIVFIWWALFLLIVPSAYKEQFTNIDNKD